MTDKISPKTITPDMADDWREHVQRALPKSLAISFRSLAQIVYEELDDAQPLPSYSLTHAVLAMAQEGELQFTPQGNIVNAMSDDRAA